MRARVWAALVGVVLFLAAGEATSVFRLSKDTPTSVSKPTTLSHNGWDNDDKRYLAGVEGSPHSNFNKEERGAISGISAAFGKLRRSAGKLKLNIQDVWRNKSLRKMEKMFEGGATPEKLAELYGTSKKVKLQEEFRQFYKWRSSWGAQGRTYPKPGNLKAVTKLERLG